MIDQFALVLGHGLMAIALWRLVRREDLDADPLLDRLAAESAAHRTAASPAGRSAARRARRAQPGEADQAAAQDPQG